MHSSDTCYRPVYLDYPTPRNFLSRERVGALLFFLPTFFFFYDIYKSTFHFFLIVALEKHLPRGRLAIVVLIALRPKVRRYARKSAVCAHL